MRDFSNDLFFFLGSIWERKRHNADNIQLTSNLGQSMSVLATATVLHQLLKLLRSSNTWFKEINVLGLAKWPSLIIWVDRSPGPTWWKKRTDSCNSFSGLRMCAMPCVNPHRTHTGSINVIEVFNKWLFRRISETRRFYHWNLLWTADTKKTRHKLIDRSESLLSKQNWLCQDNILLWC